MSELRDSTDGEVDKAMSSGASLDELIASAVGHMIEGACWGVMINLGHNAPFDPGECSRYGERLLMRCVQELQK